jgi:predicted kinase
MIKETILLDNGEDRPKIYFLKGLPASGKSTWTMANGENLNAVRINKDSLRAMMGLPYTKENEGAVVHASREMGKEALRRGLNVIVDDTNFAQKHLNAWMNIANDKSIQANLIEVYFDVDVKVCIERDKKRNVPVGEAIILKMWSDMTGGICKGDIHDYTTQNEELPKAVIVDIDGTLALTTGRNIFDDSKVHTDVPHKPVLDLVHLLYKNGFKIIFLTGRECTDSCYNATLKWLEDNVDIAFENLIMRREGDHRKDSIVKRELFDEFVKEDYNVQFVLDDRDSVVDMWRKDLKLPCFQVWYGDF